MSSDGGVGIQPPPSQPPPPPLDIALSFNVAGAFGPMHPASKTYLKHLIKSLDESLLQTIFSLTSANHKLRLALFTHGFHKNNADAIRTTQFTDDISQLCHFVSTTLPRPWGSRHHCYELVLRKARSLKWTPGSKRALVLVGCTRPHEGCHLGAEELLHWRVEARCLAQMGITIFAVEVKVGDEASDFYRDLAEITEGCHVTLEQLTPMGDVITAIVSHLASPEKLEDFEQEIIDRRDGDHYTRDMAQLFLTLRHHGNNDDVTSLPAGTPTPGSPRGSDSDCDFHSNSDSDEDEKLWRPPEPKESRPTSPTPMCPHDKIKNTSKPVIELKRSQTAPGRVVWDERGKTSLAAEAGPQANCFQRRKGRLGQSSRDGSRSGMKLRRGITSAGTLAGDGGMLRPDEAEDQLPQLLRDDPCNTAAAVDVYKIDRTAPAKRENISPRTFTLRHLSWTPWKLVISPSLPPSSDGCWEPRCDIISGCQHGYRRKTLTQNNNSPETLSAALLEVALKAEGTSRKRVVYHACLPELRDDDDDDHDICSWETRLLGSRDVQQEVSEAVGKKCSVFLRWASFAQNGGRAHKMVEAALHKYDYAWNVSHSLCRRCVRRVEFY